MLLYIKHTDTHTHTDPHSYTHKHTYTQTHTHTYIYIYMFTCICIIHSSFHQNRILSLCTGCLHVLRVLAWAHYHLPSSLRLLACLLGSWSSGVIFEESVTILPSWSGHLGQ